MLARSSVIHLTLAVATATFVACFSPGDDPADTGSGSGSDGTMSGDTQSTSGSPTSASMSASTAGTTADSTATTTDTGAACAPGTHACVDAAVDAWSGPVIVYVGDAARPPPACGGGFPDLEVEASTDLDAPPADCGCSCTPPIDAICEGAELVYYSTDATCTTPSQMFPAAGCTEFGGEFFSVRFWGIDATNAVVTGGECAPIEVEEIPAASHTSRVAVCGGATDAQGCVDGQTCVPVPAAPFESTLCIWHDGDVMCPPDSGYTERSVYYTGIDDQRNCTACSCGALGGDCDDMSATFYADAGCSGEEGATIDATNPCSTPVVATDSAMFFPTADPSCAAQGGDPTGEALQTGAHTVCCTAEI